MATLTKMAMAMSTTILLLFLSVGLGTVAKLVEGVNPIIESVVSVPCLDDPKSVACDKGYTADEDGEENVSGKSNAINFIIRNNCPYTIWPATLTGSGPWLPTTGFELPQGASRTFAAQPSWSGRIWARSQCFFDGPRFVCRSADCGSGQVACNGAGAIPPATLAEFTLNGNNNLDFFDVSLVDGFNLPVSIIPQGCSSTGCWVDVNAACPPELSVRDPRGGVIGCKSACLAFHQPQYCCTGDHNTPQTCPPTNYSQFFKRKCPQAYSYAYDDSSSTFTCRSGSTNYAITFCP